MAACRIGSLPQRHAGGARCVEGLWKTASCGHGRGHGRGGACRVSLLHDMAGITRAARGECHCGHLPRPPLAAMVSRAWRTEADPPRRPVLERFLAIAPTQLAARVLLSCAVLLLLLLLLHTVAAAFASAHTIAPGAVACVSATRPTNQCAMQIDPIPVRSRLIFYRGSRISASLSHY